MLSVLGNHAVMQSAAAAFLLDEAQLADALWERS